MTTSTFFIIFIPILSIILLLVNLLLAPHNPYQEKDSPFECGFHSFSDQNRTQFNVSFFIFAILFLLFDLEIILVYPYSVSGYFNDIYGLIIMMVFFILLALGFIFELGKNALTIESKQTLCENKEHPIPYIFNVFLLESKNLEIVSRDIVKYTCIFVFFYLTCVEQNLDIYHGIAVSLATNGPPISSSSRTDYFDPIT
jgi:NADH-ubiquinone oxidoreductase chain 3